MLTLTRSCSVHDPDHYRASKGFEGKRKLHNSFINIGKDKLANGQKRAIPLHRPAWNKLMWNDEGRPLHLPKRASLVPANATTIESGEQLLQNGVEGGVEKLQVTDLDPDLACHEDHQGPLHLPKRASFVPANATTIESGEQLLQNGVESGIEKLKVIDLDPDLACHENHQVPLHLPKRASLVPANATTIESDEQLLQNGVEGGIEKLKVIDLDPDLACHEDHQVPLHLPKRASLVPANATTIESGEQLLQNGVEGGIEKLKVIDLDPALACHEDHLQYRYKTYLEKKQAIEKFEGSLEKFSLGYLKFGFSREDDCIVYREWAPAAVSAQLIGDFNGWNGLRHQMEKSQYGVWTLHIPDINGKPGIPHRSKVKFRMQKGDGTWVDRIPAWIKWATVDPSQFGASYDGVYWNPSAPERYEFKHPRPAKPAAPRIYEAHVGMSSLEPRVASYVEFADNVLPRIKENNYNTVQLMAVMEHSYYASFGYHVTNFFAVSSRSGTPEELKYLIDKAHSLGLRVLMDIVHSHASNNVTDGLNGYDMGQSAHESYFHTGNRGHHRLWDSRLFNYGNWEVLRFLLSNLRWWLEEFQFDGFRFDGVTSMLYHHHGLNMSFTGNYLEYFGTATDVDAIVYLMLANDLIHGLHSEATVIAEDVSGMPTLGRPVHEGGVGFDYRLAMGIPDKWIEYLKHRPDEDWSMGNIGSTLLNRRYTENCIAYAESHDQSLVGDKTFAFLLMDKEMYTGMSALRPASPVVERGIALHKMIHFVTMALGGEGYLNFMGNEFGHPEWIDFPREGNGWNYDKCRRQWNLLDTDHLRYKFMNNFDRAMNKLDDEFQFLASTKQIVSCMSEKDKTIVFERGDLVFVFNFHPVKTYSGYKVGCDIPGKYRVALDSDSLEFGGHGLVGHDVDHFTSPEGVPGKPDTNFNNRPNSFKILLPSRSCQVYYKVPED